MAVVATCKADWPHNAALHLNRPILVIHSFIVESKPGAAQQTVHRRFDRAPFATGNGRRANRTEAIQIMCLTPKTLGTQNKQVKAATGREKGTFSKVAASAPDRGRTVDSTRLLPIDRSRHHADSCPLFLTAA